MKVSHLILSSSLSECDVLHFLAVSYVSLPSALSVCEGNDTVRVCVTLTLYPSVNTSTAADVVVTLATSDGRWRILETSI